MAELPRYEWTRGSNVVTEHRQNSRRQLTFGDDNEAAVYFLAQGLRQRGWTADTRTVEIAKKEKVLLLNAKSGSTELQFQWRVHESGRGSRVFVEGNGPVTTAKLSTITAAVEVIEQIFSFEVYELHVTLGAWLDPKLVAGSILYPNANMMSLSRKFEYGRGM